MNRQHNMGSNKHCLHQCWTEKHLSLHKMANLHANGVQQKKIDYIDLFNLSKKKNNVKSTDLTVSPYLGL